MPKSKVTLDQLAVGTRLLVRSRVDWRFAAVSRIAEEMVVLTGCSPTGRTYRLRREMETELVMEGPVPVLPYDCQTACHDNFGRYDRRW